MVSKSPMKMIKSEMVDPVALLSLIFWLPWATKKQQAWWDGWPYQSHWSTMLHSHIPNGMGYLLCLCNYYDTIYIYIYINIYILIYKYIHTFIYFYNYIIEHHKLSEINNHHKSQVPELAKALGAACNISNRGHNVWVQFFFTTQTML